MVGTISSKLPAHLETIWDQESPLQEKVDATSGQGFDVNRWGSCQYASALSMFDCLSKLSLYLSESEIYCLMGFQIEIGEPSRDKHEILVAKHREIYCSPEPDNDDEFTEFCEDINQRLSFAHCADGYFQILKDCGDLWSAMPLIFESFYPQCHFPNLTILGHGPSMNQIMQSDNLVIGLQGWILHYRGWVTNPDNTYAGFDT